MRIIIVRFSYKLNGSLIWSLCPSSVCTVRQISSRIMSPLLNTLFTFFMSMLLLRDFKLYLPLCFFNFFNFFNFFISSISSISSFFMRIDLTVILCRSLFLVGLRHLSGWPCAKFIFELESLCLFRHISLCSSCDWEIRHLRNAVKDWIDSHAAHSILLDDCLMVLVGICEDRSFACWVHWAEDVFVAIILADGWYVCNGRD